MENQKKEIKLPYIEKVDVTYQTYKKALFDCIGTVSEIIKNSSVFLSTDIPEYIQLLNMLNSQLVQVEVFLTDYQQTEEVV